MTSAADLLIAGDGLAYGLLLFAVAAGLSLSLGTAGLLNLAHGSLYLTGAYVGWWLANDTWSGLILAVLTAAVLGAVAGTVLALALQPLHHQLDQALATIGAALLIGQLLTRVFGAEPLSVDPPAAVAGTLTIGGQPYPTYRILFALLALGLAVALWLVIARTRTGALIRATATDPQLVAGLGISPTLIRHSVLATAGGLAAGIGALAAPLAGPAPGRDHTVLVLSLVIVITGGTGSVPGTLFAALLVGQAQTTIAVELPHLAPYAPYAMLATVAVMRHVMGLQVRSP